MMTPALQSFLTTFVREAWALPSRLTDSEQLDLASEILKRTAYLDFPPLSDDDLVLNAEEIFLQLDEYESAWLASTQPTGRNPTN